MKSLSSLFQYYNPFNVKGTKAGDTKSPVINPNTGYLQSSFSHYNALPAWTSNTFYELTQESFEGNVIARRCCELIAKSIASLSLHLRAPLSVDQTLPDASLAVPPLPMHTYKDTEHPVLQLLQRPNPMEDKHFFLESLVSYLLLTGKSYVALSSPPLGHEDTLPQELHILRPDCVQVRYNAYGFKESYVYTVDGHAQESPIDRQTGWSRIFCLSLFDPLNRSESSVTSPLCAAKKHIDLYNAILSLNLAILKNGGRPSGAIVVDKVLDDEERSHYQKVMQGYIKGNANAGNLLLLEGGAQWKEMGLSPNHLNFKDGLDSAARAIAQAFGVPPIVIGLLGDATFSNYKQARMHFWEDTVLPMADRIFSALSTWLSSLYGPVQLKYDMDSITALSMKRDDLWSRLQEASFLTDDEKRQALGYPPLSIPSVPLV